MRFWPLRFRRPRPTVSPDTLRAAAELLQPHVETVLDVRSRELGGVVVGFRGTLRVSAREATARLLEAFKPFGHTPFLRRDGDDIWVQAIPAPHAHDRASARVNVVLFLLTCVTTLIAGWLLNFPVLCDGSDLMHRLALLVFEPRYLVYGAPFAITLLSILGTHEFGHYFTARSYKTAVTLPYFLPAPPPLTFGTFGAVIRMRGPARDRDSLLDIAAAGPIAGLVIAIPVVLLALQWSVVQPVPDASRLTFGDSLLMRFLIYLTFGPLPPGTDVFIHPIGLAGWAGLFVTALNLFPVGQLDGGRIAYAVFGRRHRLVGMITFLALILLGAVTGALNWLVWAALMAFVIGFDHGPPLDDVTPLSPGRRVAGLGCLALLVVLVPPVPLQVSC